MGAIKPRPGTDATEARRGVGMTKARPAMPAEVAARRDAARATALQVTRDAIAAAAAKAAAVHPATPAAMPRQGDRSRDLAEIRSEGAAAKVAR